MTETEIEVAGFREFPLSEPARIRFVDRNWQKCFYNREGKKIYFVTIEQWGLTHIPNYPSSKAFEAFSQFQTIRGETFNVGILSPDSVQQVEAFFAEVFVKMQCQNYEDM